MRGSIWPFQFGSPRDIEQAEAKTTKDQTIQKRTEPAFIEPMQCKPVTALPADEKWTFEIKFDGYRCIAVKRGRRGHIVFSQPESAQQALPEGRRSARLARGRLRSRWRTGRLGSARETFLSASAKQPVAVHRKASLELYFPAGRRFERPSSRRFLSEAAMITKTKGWRAAETARLRKDIRTPARDTIMEASSPSAEVAKRRAAALVLTAFLVASADAESLKPDTTRPTKNRRLPQFDLCTSISAVIPTWRTFAMSGHCRRRPGPILWLTSPSREAKSQTVVENGAK